LLLRASGLTQNKDYDLGAVTGAADGDAGVPHGRLLVEFAEAVLREDDDEGAAALAAVRARMMTALGPAAVVDAAAVVGLFNAIDRVADATGIPLEADKAEASADFRAALDIDRFAVAARG
jgi:alkylhydroperoxidase family enzyme